jgi:hypothetical protein
MVKNVKTLAMLLRVFAGLTALAQLYNVVVPQLDFYAKQGDWVEGVIRSVGLFVVTMVYPILVFVGAYLLEFLHDFRERALEQIGADGSEV